MESTHTLFSAMISENKDNANLLPIIREFTFELSKKKIQRLKDEHNIQKRLSELFELYVKVLETEGLKDSKHIGAVIDGLIQASSFDKEEFLYKSIYEKEQLEKSIRKQKEEIRHTLLDTFATLESHVDDMDEDLAGDARSALNDAKLRGVEMLGILRETTTEAILTTVENATDVEDTIFEITKNLTYQAINDGEFTKQRFMDISSTVIEVAIEIADEDQGFAKEILYGAVHGTKEGMAKAIDKFKNDLKFAPEELDEILEKDLRTARKELIKIEDSFVAMLEDSKELSSGISAQIIAEILDEEFNNSFAKMRRVSAETREVIADTIEEMKTNATHLEHEFRGRAEKRFSSLKEEAGERFEALEKKASKSVESLKHFELENERAKKVALEAKRMGNRAWEVAKGVLDGALKGAKEAMNKEDKNRS